MNDLKTKIVNKDVTVGIIGLGYVGLPLFIECIKSNYKRVIGMDYDFRKTSSLNVGTSYINGISDEDIKNTMRSNRAEVETGLPKLHTCDCIIVCVPTPLDEFGSPDISYISDAFKAIKQTIIYRSNNKIGPVFISLESTTYPGCTEDMNCMLELHKLKHDDEYYLAFSPERIDPGNTKFNLTNTPKVVGGISDNATDMGRSFYENLGIMHTHPTSNTKVAEMSKLLENTYRLVNISLINELKPICEKMGIDILEVIDAAKTKPFGFHAFYPGPGIGGHCIPIDPLYFNAKAKQYSMSSRLITEAININDECTYNNVSKIFEKLKYQNDSRGSILIVGLSYKPDTADTRESPSVKIIKRLINDGMDPNYINYYDPYVKNIKIENLQFMSITEENLRNTFFSVGVIATKHKIIDYDVIIKNCENIVDLVNTERR